MESIPVPYKKLVVQKVEDRLKAAKQESTKFDEKYTMLYFIMKKLRMSKAINCKS